MVLLALIGYTSWMRTLSVTDITRAIKTALETCFPYSVEVEGEISNFRPHYSGHAYFSLKDPFSEISAVMWKSRALQLESPLANGQRVICTGQVTVYEKTGRYQLNVLNVRPVGKGDLQAQLEALKLKLWEMGYFEEDRKRPLPAYPRRVGLITSPTGAAVQDMITVARRRNPQIELILRPAQVQGEKAVPDLIKALQEFNDWGGVDVIIIGRGGGSLEDLWAFNDENLAREIFHSRLPVVSAVGHEIDVTIADLVADRRAATPSAAAELVVPRQDEMLGQLLYYQERTQDLMRQRLQQSWQLLESLRHHHALRRPQYQLENRQQHLLRLQQRLAQAMQKQLERREHQLERLQGSLEALNPVAVLERGFVQIEQQGQNVRRAAALQSGPARLRFADGWVLIKLEILDDKDN